VRLLVVPLEHLEVALLVVLLGARFD